MANEYGIQPNNAAGGTAFHFRQYLVDDNLYRKFADMGASKAVRTADNRGAYFALPYNTAEERAAVDNLVAEWKNNFNTKFGPVTIHRGTPSENALIERLGGQYNSQPDGTPYAYTFISRKTDAEKGWAPADARYAFAENILAGDYAAVDINGQPLTYIISDANFKGDRSLGTLQLPNGDWLVTCDASLTHASAQAAFSKAIEHAQANAFVTDAEKADAFPKLEILDKMGLLSEISDGALGSLADYNHIELDRANFNKLLENGERAFATYVAQANAPLPSETLLAVAKAEARAMKDPEAARAHVSYAVIASDTMRENEDDLVATRDTFIAATTFQGKRAQSLKHAVQLSGTSQQRVAGLDRVTDTTNTAALDARVGHDRPMTTGGYTPDVDITKLAGEIAKTSEDARGIARALTTLAEDLEIRNFRLITLAKGELHRREHEPFLGVPLAIVNNAIVVEERALKRDGNHIVFDRYPHEGEDVKKHPIIVKPEHAEVRVYNAHDFITSDMRDNPGKVFNAWKNTETAFTIGFAESGELSFVKGQWRDAQDKLNQRAALDQEIERDKPITKVTNEREEDIAKYDQARLSALDRHVAEACADIARSRGLDVITRQRELQKAIKAHTPTGTRPRKVTLDDAYASFGIVVVRPDINPDRRIDDAYEQDVAAIDDKETRDLRGDTNPVAHAQSKLRRIERALETATEAFTPDDVYEGSDVEYLEGQLLAAKEYLNERLAEQAEQEQQDQDYTRKLLTSKAATNVGLNYDDVLGKDSGMSIGNIAANRIRGTVLTEPNEYVMVVAAETSQRETRTFIYVLESPDMIAPVRGTEGTVGIPREQEIARGNTVEVRLGKFPDPHSIEIIDPEQVREIQQLEANSARENAYVNGIVAIDFTSPLIQAEFRRRLGADLEQAGVAHASKATFMTPPDIMNGDAYPIKHGPFRAVAIVGRPNPDKPQETNVAIIQDPMVYNQVTAIDGRGKPYMVGANVTIKRDRNRGFEITNYTTKHEQALQQQLAADRRAEDLKLEAARKSAATGTDGISGGR